MRWFLAGALLIVALGACDSHVPADSSATITGRLVAGPICPVETNPPDPDCAPRPVPDTEVIATLSDGTELRIVSSLDGTFRIALPPGEVVITFAVDEASMLAPDPITATIVANQTLDLGDLTYDTGIR
jgi:hypothetical protein